MKNLIAYMLLSALAINMVPGKNYQRYISLTGGLIMIILLVKPLLGIFGGDDGELIKKIENYMNVADDIEYSMDDIVKAGETAENFLADMPDYETVGSEAAVRTVLQNMGVELENLEMTKDKNGEILRIIAVVTVGGVKNDETLSEDADTDALFMKIKEYISEVYNLDTNSIYVVGK